MKRGRRSRYKENEVHIEKDDRKRKNNGQDTEKC